MTTRRVNVHQIYFVHANPEDPDEAQATPAGGPIQLVWNSRTPEEVLLVLADGEFTLARERFFSTEDFPEGAVSSVMSTGPRMVFKVPAAEGEGYVNLLMSNHAEEIKAWVWETYLDDNPASADFDAELARLLDGTL